MTSCSPDITTPVVELKKFKHAPFASKETQCFEADVCINGKPAFHASNEGNGGCDHYTPITYDEAGNRSLKEGLAILTGHTATLPPYESAGSGLSLPMDVELFITTLVSTKLEGKEVQRLRAKLKDRILMLNGGKLLSTQKLPAMLMTSEKIEFYAAKHPHVRVLNLMPATEQDVILLKTVRGEELS